MTQEQARKLFYDMVVEIEGIREKIDYGVISIKGSAPGSTDYIAVKLKQQQAYKNMRSFYNNTLRPLRFGYHVYSKWPLTKLQLTNYKQTVYGMSWNLYHAQDTYVYRHADPSTTDIRNNMVPLVQYGETWKNSPSPYNIEAATN